MTDPAKRVAQTRSRRMRAGLMLVAAGCAAAAGGLILGMEGEGGASIGGWTAVGIGAAVLVAGGLMAWIQRATPEDQRVMDDAPTRRDREQRQRRGSLFMVAGQFMFAMIIGLPAIGRILEGEGRWADGVFALFVVAMAWIALAMVQGWDGQSRKARKYLEDEWTRSLRGNALSWGYVVLLAGISLAYGVSLYRPEATPWVLALAIAAGGAAPALRFATVDKAADD